MILESFISNIFDGKSKAYIYIWFSNSAKVIYIGMTNSSSGTLGRAASHVKTDGTLRKRFKETVGLNLEAFNDFILYSFLLPNYPYFVTVERSYREAVEYLVQKDLQLLRNSFSSPYEVISWVRDSPRTNNAVVKKAAKQIVNEFSQEYSKYG